MSFSSVRVHAAMSAGEGLDEAAKDAVDIAAFFKSGKSGEERASLAPVELSVWSHGSIISYTVAKMMKVLWVCVWCVFARWSRRDAPSWTSSSHLSRLTQTCHSQPLM